MDYNKINKVENIDSNGDIILQDVNGSTITVNYNDPDEFGKLLILAKENVLGEIKAQFSRQLGINSSILATLNNNLGLSSEIKEIKTYIYQKIFQIRDFIHAMKSSEITNPEINNDEDDSFEGINFDELILSIENDNCVLFIGPEIALDENGESLHEKYFNHISNDKMKYNPEDCFFMPGLEPRLMNIMKPFYSEIFPKQNLIGYAILEKLAQLPFNLIISYCPDDTLKRIVKKYNLKHEFYSYNGQTIDIKENPGVENPIIYNALGCAAENGRYIFTHKQFNEYLIKIDEEKKLPIKIASKINSSTNYIFLGFSFNSWYYRLLMFGLNFMENSGRVAFETTKVKPIHKDFLNLQFGITFINANYVDFASKLLRKAQKKGICKTLLSRFVENIIEDLRILKIRSIDSNKFEELDKIKTDLDNLEIKIIENRT